MNLLDIYVPDHSHGLMVDALVLQEAIGIDRVKIVKIPYAALHATKSANDRIVLEPSAPIGIFLERLFEHSVLQSYARRVLVQNPEWLSVADGERAILLVDEFWHKTRFSEHRIGKRFPSKKHRYIGFTSLSETSQVCSYESIGHFSGKSKTRHTQEIVNLWLMNRKLPPLTLQAYDLGISIPQWLHLGNMRLFLGFLEEKQWRDEFERHGLQLCTSQMEGFGHYINESRAVGALTITLAAPPMDELIDDSCGILIPYEKAVPHRFGCRFVASEAAIHEAVKAALMMPLQKRRAMGTRATERFVDERRKFQNRLRSLIS